MRFRRRFARRGMRLSCDSWGFSFFLCFFYSFAGFSFGPFFNTIELVSPEFFEHFGPVVNGFKALAVNAVEALAAFLTHGDETYFFQHAQVLGDHGLRPAEVMDQAVDGHFAVGEYFEYASALGLGDGIEGVECGWGSGHGFVLGGELYSDMGICQAGKKIFESVESQRAIALVCAINPPPQETNQY